MCVLMYVYMHKKVKVRGVTSESIPQELPTLCFETEFLTGPGLTKSAMLPGQEAPRIGLFSTSSTSTTGQHYMVSFLHGFWGLNLGPRACTASTFQVELSPQLLTKFFWLFPKNMTTQVSQLKCTK